MPARAAGEVVELADQRREDLGQRERDEREVEALEPQGGDADEHADGEADRRAATGRSSPGDQPWSSTRIASV